MCKEVFTKLSLTFEDRLQINQLYVNYRTPYEYFWSQHFKCRGDEDKLKDCPMVHHQELCQSGLSAAINCDFRNESSPPQTLLLRGRGQIYSSREGLVAFRIDNGMLPQKQVYLCNDGIFHTNEANVACRSVGRNNGGKVVVASQFYKHNQIEFMMTSVSCIGNEQSLYECAHTFTCWEAEKNYQHIRTDCLRNCTGDVVGVWCY